jgi:hypothetical protein
VLLLASISASAAALLGPSDPQRLTAIFPPWWSREASLVAASRSGAVTGFGALPFIIAVHSNDPDFARRLHASGALVLVDGSKFPFCGFQ